MYECKIHPRGHRTEEARDACIAKSKRRKERKAKAAADARRREKNLERESIDAYVRRRFCVEGTPAVNVAASLNREYPRRTPPWDWASVITIHSENHIKWPGPGVFEAYLKANPEILLPSEVRKLAGESVESSRDI